MNQKKIIALLLILALALISVNAVFSADVGDGADSGIVANSLNSVIIINGDEIIEEYDDDILDNDSDIDDDDLEGNLGVADSRNIWVDPVNGVDQNSGNRGTEQNPVKTIGFAVRYLTSGGNIHLKPGTYSGSTFTNAYSGTYKSVNYIGHPTATQKVILDGQNTRLIMDLGQSTGWFASDLTVTISNITFQNGRNLNSHNGFGGAIYSTVRYLTINNCEFLNNYAGDVGGAIRIGASASSNYEFNMNNCYFKGNSVALNAGGEGSHGGAVCSYASSGEIRNCIFDGNTAAWSGAFHAHRPNQAFYNCTFINNEAVGDNSNDGHGGAVSAVGTGASATTYNKFVDCTFKDNYAADYGAGIEITSNYVYVDGCTFEGNDAPQGSAININGANTRVLNSNITGNGIPDAVTGAVYIIGNNAQITSTTLDSNYASGDGAAVYIRGNSATLTDITADGNAAGGNGGAIYIQGNNININGLDIGNNSATNGGAVYINSPSTTITNVTGGDNKASNNGGAIYVQGNDAQLRNIDIDRNTATDGGAIYIEGARANFNDVSSDDNIARDQGGAIYVDQSSAIFTNVEVNGNTAREGGAIYISQQGTNARFTNVTANNNNATSGGGIFVNANDAIFRDATVDSNNATSGGGVYISGNNAEFTNVKVDSNNAVNGAGIYISGNKTHFTGVELDSNNATNNGGGVYISGNEAEFTNIEMNSNTANNQGGAVYISGDDSVFTNVNGQKNTANEGGAIYVLGQGATFYQVLLSLNNATKGGAIYIMGDDATFENLVHLFNNTAEIGGGIYIEGDRTTLQNDVSFEDNRAFDKGAGAYIVGEDANIIAVNFLRNIAYVSAEENNKGFGGGLYIIGTANIEQAVFGQNVAVNGSAIYVIGYLNISNSQFLDNLAKTYQLAVDVDPDESYTPDERKGEIIVLGGDNIIDAIYNCESKFYQRPGSDVWYAKNIQFDEVTYTVSMTNTTRTSTPEEYEAVVGLYTEIEGQTVCHNGTIIYQDAHLDKQVIYYDILDEEGNSVIGGQKQLLTELEGSQEIIEELEHLKPGVYNLTVEKLQNKYYMGLSNFTLFTILPVIDHRINKTSVINDENCSSINWTINVKNYGLDNDTDVYVIDTLPQGLTVSSWVITVTDKNGIQTKLSPDYFNPTTLRWEVGEMVNGTFINIVGNMYTLTLTTLVGAIDGSITNKVEVFSEHEAEVNRTNNKAENTTIIPSIKPIKTVDKNTPLEGETIEFTITVSNDHPTLSAKGVVISDYLDPRLIWNGTVLSNSTKTNLVYNAATRTFSTTVDLDPLETIVFKIYAIVNETGFISNTATTLYKVNRSSTVYLVDLNITKEAIDVNGNPITSINYGDDIIWRIKVTNPNEIAVQNIEVYDYVPWNAVTNVITNPNAQNISGRLVWIADIAAKGDAQHRDVLEFIVRATVNTYDNILNIAEVAGRQANTTTSVRAVEINKTVNDSNPGYHDNITYYVDLYNNMTKTATDVVVWDILAPGLELTPEGLAEIRSQNGNYDPTTRNISWTVPSIEAGKSYRLYIKCRTIHTGDVSNTAYTNVRNSTISINVRALQLNKTINNENPVHGERIQYTINLTNPYDEDYHGVVVIDNLPDGIGVTQADIRVTAGDALLILDVATAKPYIIWENFTLAAKSSLFMYVNGTVNGYGVIINKVTVEDVTVTNTITVYDITLEKNTTKDNPQMGESFDWYITLHNNNDKDATRVVVTDNKPADFIVTSITGENGAVLSYTNVNNLLTISIPRIIALSNYTVHINGYMNATGEFTNYAHIYGRDANSTIVVPSYSITKNVTVNKIYQVGDEVTYKIVVRNTNDLVGYNIAIKDLYDATKLQFLRVNGNVRNVDNITFIVDGAFPTGGVTFNITFKVLDYGIINNTAVVADKKDSELITVANLTVTKTVNNDHPNLGDEIEFTINIQNPLHQGTLTNVTLRDVIGDGLIFLRTNYTTNFNSATKTWTNLTIGPNGLTIKVTARVNKTGILNNTVNMNDANGLKADKTATSYVYVPEYDINKTSQNTAKIGEEVQYTITIKNTNNIDGKNVVLTDVWSNGYFELVGTPSIPGTATAHGYTWTFATFAAGETKTITLTLRVLNGGILNNTVTVNNITKTKAITVEDISITKNINDTTPNYGDKVNYTIVVKNDLDIIAHNVTIWDVIDAKLSNVHVYINGVERTIQDRTVRWNGNIAAHSNITINVIATVNGYGDINNTAFAKLNNYDPIADDANITVARYTINKTSDKDVVLMNNTVTYTIKVTNDNNVAGSDIKVIDTWDASKFAFVSAATIPGVTGERNGNKYTWTIASFAAGTFKELTLTLRTLANGTLNNHAEVFNYSADKAITVPEVTVTKSAYKSNYNYNDTIVYTINVHNPFDVDISNITIWDEIDSNIKDIIVTVNGQPVTLINNKLQWNGPIAHGGNINIIITGRVEGYGLFENEVIVNDNNGKANNKTANASFVVAKYDISKNTTTHYYYIGDQVVYTFNVTNVNNIAGQNVVITDLFDSNQLEFVGDSLNNGGVATTGKVTWTVNIPVNGLVFNATFRILNGSTITNFVKVNDENDTEVIHTFALNINKTVNNTHPDVGDRVKYTINITNPANSSTIIKFEDILDAGLIYNGTNLAGGLTKVGNKYTANINVPAGGLVFEIYAIVNSTGVLNNLAQMNVTYGTNSSTATVYVTNYTITKTTTTTVTLINNTVVFTIHVTNENGIANTNVDVKDTWDNTQFAYVSFTAPAGVTYTYNPGELIWHIANFAADGDYTFTLTLRTLKNGTLTNYAEVKDHEDSASVKVIEATVNKTVSDNNPNIGDIIRYDINITNNFDEKITNVTLTDTLDARLMFINATDEKSLVQGSLIWTNLEIDAHSSIVKSIYVKVIGYGAINNVAIINDNNGKGANKQDSELINVPQYIINKTADRADKTYSQSEQIIYYINVTNTNNIAGKDIVVIDHYNSTELQYVGSNGTILSNVPGEIKWNIASFGAGKSVIIRVVFNPLVFGEINNTAEVNGIKANESITIISLTVNKTVNNTHPNIGELVDFTLNITNPSNDTVATGINVYDILGEGLQFISIVGNESKFNNATKSWTNLTVGPNGVILHVIAKVVAYGELNNTVKINQNGKNEKVDTAYVYVPEYNITKVANDVNKTYTKGETVTYTITITNTNNYIGYNVPVFDYYNPAELQYVGTTATPGVISRLFNITAGNSTTWTVSFVVLGTGNITNNVTVFDKKANETIKIIDLTITKSANVTNPHIGDLVDYTIVISNPTGGLARNVTVWDVLDAGLVFNSTTLAGYQRNGQTITWTNLNIDGTLTFHVVARVNAYGTLINNATVYDHNSNKSDDATVYVPEYNITKVANDVNKTYSKGEIVTYTITIKNTNNIAGTNIKVSDYYNTAELQYLDGVNNGVLTRLFNIGANGTATWTVRFVVLGTGNITNNVTVFDKKDNETIKVINLTISKTANVTNPNYGDLVDYTIVISNPTGGLARNVTVWDVLDAGLVFNSTTLAGYQRNGQTITWTNLNIAESLTFHVVARVNAYGDLINNATVYDHTVNKSAIATVIVPEYNITKEATKDGKAYSYNETVVYVITVNNTNARAGTNVTIIDTYNANELTFTGSNILCDSSVPGKLVWTLNLTSGNVTVISVSFKVKGSGNITNTVTVNNYTDTETIEVIQLAVNKTVNNTHPNYGDIVEFIINITNPTDGTIYGVNITDVLGTGLDYLWSSLDTNRTVSGNTIKWHMDIGSEGLVIRVRAKVIGYGVLNNTVYVNDYSSIKDDVAYVYVPEYNITKEAVDSVARYNNITYKINITNINNIVGYNITVTDSWIAGQLGLNGSTTANSKSWTFTEFAAGTSKVVYITLTALVNGTITNNVTVNNKNATKSVIVYEVTVTKNVTNVNPNYNDTITYIINITNPFNVTATNITVTDVLSNGLVFISATEGYNKTTGKWTGLIINANRSKILTITVRIKDYGMINNTVFVNDNNGVRDDKNASIAINVPEYNITKVATDVNKTYSQGEEVTYNIQINNTNAIKGTDVTIIDTYNADELTFVGSNVNCDSSVPGKLVWTINMTATGSRMINVTFIVKGTGTIVNTVKVNNYTATENITIVGLNVNKTVNNTHPNYGDRVEYLINITNPTNGTARNVTVHDVLDSGLIFNGTNYTTNFNQNTLTWTNLTIGPNGLLIKLYAIVNRTGVLNNTVFVNDNNGVASDKNSTATVYVPQYEVTKVANDSYALHNNVTYTITVTNINNIAGYNVTVTDTWIAEQLNFAGSDVLGTRNGNKYTWIIPEIAAGNSTIIHITFTTLVNGTITNNVTLNNNTTSCDIVVYELIATKVVNNTNPNYNDTILYTIVINNPFNGTANNVSVWDAIDSRLYIISTNYEFIVDIDRNTNVVTWTGLKIEPNSSINLTIKARVIGYGNITNFAAFNDNNGVDDNKTTNTVDTKVPYYNITKTSEHPSYSQGQTVVYTITIENTNNITGKNVVIYDEYKSNQLLYQSSTITPVSTLPCKWIIPEIAAGGKVTFNVTFIITGSETVGDLSVIYNTAKVNNVSTTYNITLTGLNINKKVNYTSPNIGDYVSYNITVHPRGSTGGLSDVNITDLPGTGLEFVRTNQTEGFDEDTLTWTGLTIPDNGLTILIIFKVVGFGVIPNNATVYYGDNSTTSSDLINVPNYNITKTAVNSTGLNNTVTFDITVTNINDANGYNITVWDTWNATEFVYAGASVNGTHTDNRFIYTIPYIERGKSVTFKVYLTTLVNGTVSNNASLPLYNKSAIKNVTVTEVIVEKTSNATVNPNYNDIIEYNITITNPFNETAYNITAWDNLGDDLVFISATRGGVNTTAHNVIWTNLNIGKNSYIVLTVLARVINYGNITNLAIVNDNNGKSDNKTSTSTVSVPYYNITKEALDNNKTYTVGEYVVYEIVVNNTNNLTGYNVTVTDTFNPGELIYNSTTGAIVDTSKASQGIISWTLTTVATDVPTRFTVTFRVNGTGTIKNTVTVNNVTANENITIVNLTVNKTVVNELVNYNNTAVFVINVTNPTNGTAHNVTVTDVLGEGLVYDHASVNPTAINGNVITWIIDVPANGLVIYVYANVTEYGVLNNTVKVDDYTSNKTDNASVYVGEYNITKTADVANKTYVNGEYVVYTITVTNMNGLEGQNVVVIDTYDDTKLEYDSTTGVIVNQTTGRITWNVASIDANGNATFTVTFKVIGTGNITNTVTVNNYTGTETIEVIELAVNKTAVNELVNYNGTAVFVINVTNPTNGTAHAVNVTDILGEGLVYDHATIDPTAVNGNVISWIIDVPANGLVIYVYANVTDYGVLNNTVKVDDHTSNKTDNASVYVGEYNITKTADVTNKTYVRGEYVVYTITVTNMNGLEGQNVVVIDTYDPTKLQYNSTTGVIVNQTTGRITWNVASIDANGNATFTVTFKVLGTGNIVNTVTVNNYTGSETIQVIELDVNKTAEQQNVNINNTAVFIINVTNPTNGTAHAVNVTDILGEGLVYDHASIEPTKVNGNVITWIIDVPSNGLIIYVYANATEYGVLNNTVKVDDHTSNKTDNASVYVGEYNITKTADVANKTYVQGEYVVYTITVTNINNLPGSNVIVIDTYDDTKLQYISTTGVIVNQSTGKITWNVASIDANGNATFTVTFKIINNGNITNTVTVNNYTGTETIEIIEIAVNKTVVSELVNYNGTAVFVINVTNPTNGTAHAVNVTDILGEGLVYDHASVNPTAINGNVITWIIDVPSNGIVIYVYANVTEYGVLNNTVKVDDYTSNKTDNASVYVGEYNITKTADVANKTYVNGEYVVYTITVTNLNGLEGQNVVVIDTYDDTKLEYDSTTGVIVNQTAGRITWNVASIDANGNATFTVTFKVIGTGNITNTVTVNNYTGTETIEVIELNVNKTAVEEYVNYNGTAVFIINVTNPTNGTAHAVNVTDILGEGLVYDHATINPTAINGNIISWIIDVPSNGLIIYVYANVTDYGVLNNTVKVDDHTSNKTDNASVKVAEYEITIDAVDSVARYNNITYTITIKNINNITGYNITVTDSWIAEQLKLPGSDATNFTWVIDRIDANGTATRTITLTALVNGTVTNNATVFDKFATKNVTVFEVIVTKNVTDVHPNYNGTVTYIINVTNPFDCNATNITVRDIIDPKLEVLSGTTEWTNLTIGPNKSILLYITVRVKDYGMINNTVFVNDNNGVAGDKNASKAIYVPEYNITKVANNANKTYAQGDVVEYTITVTNTNNITGHDIVVYDKYDNTKLKLIGDSNTGLFNFTIATLAPGEIKHYTFRFIILAGLNETVSNIAIVNNKNTTENITVVGLNVTKSINVTNPNYGDLVVFNITIENKNENTFTNVTVKDILPNGVEFVDTDYKQGFNRDTLTWTNLTIAPGKFIIKVYARVNVYGALNNTVKVNDNNGLSDDLTADVDFYVPLVGVQKTADDKQYFVGDEVNYTIIVNNTSEYNATNVVVSDVLPDGLTNIETDGNYDPTTRTVTWTVNLTAHTSTTFYVSGVFTTSGVVVNRVVSGNQTGNKTINVYDVEVTKEANISNVNVGEIVNFTITVNNTGNLDITNLTVTDILPSSLRLIDCGNGTYDPTTRIITWNVDVAVGETATVNVVVEVLESGVIENIAIAGNDNDTARITTYNYEIEKVANTTNAYVGDEVKYDITINNTGSLEIELQVVVDCLPDGVEFVSAENGTYNNETRTVTWTVNVPVNGTITVSVIVKVIAEGNITNVVISGNKNTTETITSHNLTIAKEALVNGTVYVGDNVDYRIVVNNTGSEPITNLTVTDILPEGVTFINATGNYTYKDGKIIWTIDLGVNETIALYVTVRADKEGVLTNIVTAANENSTSTINVTKKNEPVPPGPEPTPSDVVLPETGNPLIALLLMLLVIPIIRRKERK